jgi:phosphoribosyl-ATP pyrophosphohydrolase
MSDKLISLQDLYKIVADKIANQEDGSYSYEIAKAGLEKSTRKVGEEALEVVIASFIDEKENSDKTHQDLVGELADLYYHTLILMAQRGVNLEEVLQELTNRNNKN